MGLSGPKKRTKISSDPNNLTWANSTDTFGHKILTAAGWKPGEYLGARNAAQADHYTAANASSIRVLLREDNLGLGAKIGKGNAETFGLSMFSGLLGRLNGKSDAELQTQQNAQRDVELRMYQASKYGTMNFVYGGLLVGDKMEDRKLADVLKSDVLKSDKATGMTIKASSADSRKRKAEEGEGEEGETILKKKQKKEKKRKERDENESTSSGKENNTRSSRNVLMKKEKSGKSRKLEALISAKTTSASDEDSSGRQNSSKPVSPRHRQAEEEDDKDGLQVETDAQRALRKQEKRARKEERRKRKDEKRKRKAEKKAVVVEAPAQTLISSSEGRERVSPVSQAQVAINRHAVRHRYIQQKRMASLNPQALKEIFMLQAAS